MALDRKVATLSLAVGMGIGMGVPGVAQAQAPGAAAARSTAPLATAKELLAQRRWPEAEAELRRVVSTSRVDAELLVLLGQTLKRTGKLQEATETLEQAVELQPRHRAAREALGSAYLLVREPEKAAAQLEALRQLCAGPCPELRSLAGAISGYSP